MLTRFAVVGLVLLHCDNAPYHFSALATVPYVAGKTHRLTVHLIADNASEMNFGAVNCFLMQVLYR